MNDMPERSPEFIGGARPGKRRRARGAGGRVLRRRPGGSDVRGFGAREEETHAFAGWPAVRRRSARQHAMQVTARGGKLQCLAGNANGSWVSRPTALFLQTHTKLYWQRTSSKL